MVLERVWKSTGGLFVLQKFYKIIFRENGLDLWKESIYIILCRMPLTEGDW